MKMLYEEIPRNLLTVRWRYVASRRETYLSNVLIVVIDSGSQSRETDDISEAKDSSARSLNACFPVIPKTPVAVACGRFRGSCLVVWGSV